MKKTLVERLNEPMGTGGRPSPDKNPALEAAIAKHNQENPLTTDQMRAKIAAFCKGRAK